MKHLPLLFLFATCLTGNAKASQFIDGSFVMMSSETCNGGNPEYCYLRDAAASEKVITDLARTGAKQFLLPSAEIDQLRLLARPIQKLGLTFYTYERWTFENASQSGKFDCAYYTKERLEKDIAPLKAEFGQAFAGLHYKDEPPTQDIARLGALTNCVKADPRFQDLKIFINLLPLHANAGSYAGTQHAGAMSPAEYGVDCRAGTISNPTRTAAMVQSYSNYAMSISDMVRPDFLSFDLYPFVSSLSKCPVARALLMSENMSIISNLARSRNQTSVAYLQNVETIDKASTSDPFYYANFHDLRWFASWFFVFGGNGFANFISHNTGASTNTARKSDFFGLLSEANVPTHLASDQQSLHGFTSQVQTALIEQKYLGFVDNSLGVPSGAHVGWIPDSSMLVGEYSDSSSSKATLIFARRNPREAASTSIGLNKWWSKIEMLNFETGVWTQVGTSTNRIDVALSSFPGAIYRLTP
ncbi:hypothetical protein VDS41_05870 [Xanthomonas campestris pv. campestris]|nr:hypothetical protein [Xanthomonas campestris pv. campestris]